MDIIRLINILLKKEIEELIKNYLEIEKNNICINTFTWNLGDQAIIIVIKRYLKDKCLEKLILEIWFKKYNNYNTIKYLIYKWWREKK